MVWDLVLRIFIEVKLEFLLVILKKGEWFLVVEMCEYYTIVFENYFRF